MPWVKVDDHFDEHPKMAMVGPLGWGVWLAGLAYCNRNLTDGFIPYSIAEGIGGSWVLRIPENDESVVIWHIEYSSGMHGQGMDTQFVIDLLVAAGLWGVVDGGYKVHDYQDFQPSRETVLADREKVRDRVEKHRNARRNPVTNGTGNTVTNAVTNGGVTPPPVPVPVPVPEDASLRSHPDARDAFETYQQLTGSFPSPKVTPWLSRLVDEFGEEEVCQCLIVVWTETADRQGFLGRVQDELRADAHRSAKDDEDRRKAAERAEREQFKREMEAMPLEKRQANMARLGTMLKEHGILP